MLFSIVEFEILLAVPLLINIPLVLPSACILENWLLLLPSKYTPDPNRKPKFFQLHRNYYFDIFGFSTIKVDIIVPGKNPEEYVLYDNKQGESSTTTNVPVSVYDPISKKKDFGVLIITKY